MYFLAIAKIITIPTGGGHIDPVLEFIAKIKVANFSNFIFCPWYQIEKYFTEKDLRKIYLYLYLKKKKKKKKKKLF